MYSLFRIIIFIILFVLCILLYKTKSRNINKNAIIIIGVINITLCTISFLIPIENLFLKFESPEKVFKYQYNSKLIDVIEGENSGMILYHKDDTYSFTIIPKVENSWKLGTINDYKEIANKNVDGGIINVYKYNNHEDYYITIMFPITDKDNNNIYDNISSNFEKFSKDINNTDRKTIIYYANIKNFSDEYIITVNNINVKFNK